MRRADLAAVLQGGGVPPLPPKPTRDQVCAVRCELQGLMVNGAPWFEPQMADLTDPSARLAVYAQKRAIGDTHVNLSLDLTGLDGLAWRKQLIREAITSGGMNGVLLMCMGDGDEHNHDPGALGYDWLMANFAAIYAYMQQGEDLTPWIVFCPGYDGVVPAWQPPSKVDAFAFMARDVIDAGNGGALALELSSGYAVWAGDEFNNWITPAGQCFDVILQELNIRPACPEPPPPNFAEMSDEERAPWDQTWQMMGRMLRPYHRPSDQPDWDDPNPPFLLDTGTPRGRYYYIVWEAWTYQWCREQSVTPARINAGLAYIRAAGGQFIQGDVPT